MDCRGSYAIVSKFNATGSMLGYLYQCREALLLAIAESKSHPALAISIERFDDVAFEQGGNPTEQVQLKHHVNTASLTDLSVDLWKTIRIWSEQIADDPQLPFERRFSILTTATAPEGSAAKLLRATRPRNDAEAEALKLLLTAATNSTNKESAAGRAAFLALPVTSQRNLLAAVRVYDEAPNITNARGEIEEMLSFAVPIEKIESLVDHLEGWWFAQVVHSLSTIAAPAISLLTLRQKIDEIASAFRTGDLLISPAALMVTDGDMTASDNRIFVEQMRCVGVAADAIELAKRDFYRATAQRSAWARENVLLDGESVRYDADLVERWMRERLARENDTAPASDDDKKKFGRDLFHWASRAQQPFRNRHEQWLCSGSYQILADGMTVGWHPDHAIMFGVPAQGKAA